MTPSPPSKTPEEIAELIEALTGQPFRGNVAHTLWTHIWQQLDEIRNLLLIQTAYLEFFLIEHLKYSTEDIDEFLGRKALAQERLAEQSQTAESPDGDDTTSAD